MLIKLVSKYISTIGDSLPLLVVAGMFLAGTYHFDDLHTERLLKEFGSKAPSDEMLGYTYTEFNSIIVDQWGEKGCSFYLNVAALYKFLYALAQSTLLSSVLWRMLSKREWDNKGMSYPAQLLFVFMIANTIEIGLECMACSSSNNKDFPLVLVAMGDLCNKVKRLAATVGVVAIVVLVIIFAYIWPLFMLGGNKISKSHKKIIKKKKKNLPTLKPKSTEKKKN
mmetsp:Transcript_23887/g.26383  ORF Transcript_23887/g.26383 Transcript_23887/m.26383 type:complete len:224 (+) Transcript_23887:73-744(+)